MRFSKYSIPLALILILVPTILFAGTYQIPWHTVDGGGVTAPGDSVGGDYAIAGTIGQPDASSFTSPMIGGDFEIVGGFWATPIECLCLGDMNGDGNKDGLDIQQFVGCLNSLTDCSCADIDQVNGATLDDLALFVDALVGGEICN